MSGFATRGVRPVSHANYIGGRWAPAVDGSTDPVVDPATGETIAEVASSGAADVDAAVTAASRAFEAWSGLTPADRSRALLRIADRLEEHADGLVQLESRNVGKPISAAVDELPQL